MGKLTELEFGAHNYRGLLSSIPFTREFTVVSVGEKKTVGTLEVRFAMTLEPGDEFLLAGEPWQVEHVRAEEARVLVSPGQAEKPPRWSSGIGGLSYLVAQECWRILTQGSTEAAANALSPVAAKRIGQLQRLAADIGLKTNTVPATLDPDEKRWWLLTFAGRAANALLRDMARCFADAYDARISGFSVALKCPMDAAALWEQLSEHMAVLSPSKLGELVHEPKPLTTFARFLPVPCLQQANAELQYDFKALRELLGESTLGTYAPEELLRLEAALTDTR